MNEGFQSEDQLKAEIFDILKEKHQEDLDKLDNLMLIFYLEDEVEFERARRQKEELLRFIQVESVKQYLNILNAAKNEPNERVFKQYCDFITHEIVYH